MLKINRLYLNCGPLKSENRYRITETPAPRLSWEVLSDGCDLMQTACRVQVWCGPEALWDSGWRTTADQHLDYGGAPLPAGRRISFSAAIRDSRGETSEPAADYFFLSGLNEQVLGWIAAPEDVPNQAIYFRRDFSPQGRVRHAVLYACGLGYHQLMLNGEPLDDARLDPANSNYAQTVYYVMLPELEQRLLAGENCLGVVLGEGWRRNEGSYLEYLGDRKVEFFGVPQLSLMLSLEYEDGRRETIGTDASWHCGPGAIVYNHLFNGETTDSRMAVPGWNLAGHCPASFRPALPVPAPGGRAATMLLEPVCEQEIYPARTITPLSEGVQVADFGQNIAGVCRLRLPTGLRPGQVITIGHMEFLDEDGSLYLPNLRGARCRDTYIAAGNGADPDFWQPRFTYHGFRYAQVTGLPVLPRQDICAVSLYTDIASDSFFTCGSGLVNAIQKAIVQTEKANIHSILTDCPQRDERMGWMNDATVRFEETPYNFEIGRLFPKVLQDLLDTQGPDGSITCTAPWVYGNRPADPVSSSFLVAGMQALLHTGNLAAIAHAYDGFAGWEDCLASHAEGQIINYSYYGDWAGPAYACQGGETNVDAVFSLDTPGILMSTGFYYFNATLLAKFAALLGKTADVVRYTAMAESIRQAMLDKWWDGETGRMASGSQGCQSLALWLGILPEDKRQLAADRLHDDLVRRHYRFTTGNLCTRYMMDVLADYGYIDDAWTLITREEYPSIGYMLQQEATTVWERFELKKNPGMNSHNHPMYAAVGYWFYAYLAGIKPTAPGFAAVDIRPFFPRKLQSAQASVDTVRGDLAVRWVRRYGRLYLYVTIPFGVQARVFFDGRQHDLGSGFWTFSRADDANNE